MDNVKIFPDAAALAQGAAEQFVALADAAMKARGRFSVSLSGGSTPKATYALLATPTYAARVGWSKVHVFWGDERTVPPDHPDSDYKMAKETLLDHVPLPVGNIYRMRAENDPAAAASEYERILRQFFVDTPRFDLMLLGMGDDGHTASLFPHTTALKEQTRWVVENRVEKLNTWRVTLSPLAINASANITFLAAGAGKAERLKQVLQGAYQPDELPSQLIKPTNGELVWLVDAPAAAQLAQGSA